MPTRVRVAAVAGALLAALPFAWLLFGGRLDNALATGPFTSDFYDAQAQALLDGEIAIPADVAGLEGFAMEDGHTQIYFGLFPALLRLPIAATADGFDGRLGVLSMLLAFAVLLWATSRLVWRVRGQWSPAEVGRADAWAVGWYVFLVGASSPVLVLAAHPAVYFESLLWALALVVATFERVVALLERWRWPVAGQAALFATFALSSRASVGAAAVVALGMAFVGGRRQLAHPGACAVAVVLVTVPLVAYSAVNQARFGHPFAVPWERQVYSTVDDGRREALAATDGRLLGLQYAPTALLQYLRPDAFRPDDLLPWVAFRSTTVVGDVSLDIEERASSLPDLAPALVVLASFGAVAVGRRRDRVWAGLVGAGAVGAVGVLTIASIANRYVADFMPLVVLLSIPGLWWATALWRQSGAGVRRAALIGAALLTLVGTFIGFSLTLTSQRLHLFPTDEEIVSFVDLQYEWHERWPGGRPPEVTVASELPDIERVPFGRIIVLLDCAGVYFASDERWVPLERGPGKRFELTGRIDPAGTSILVADGWSADLVPVAERVQLRAGAPRAQGLVSDDVVLALDEPLELVVEADREGGVLRVGHDGRWVASAFGLALPERIEAATGWSVDVVEVPRCNRLLDELRR